MSMHQAAPTCLSNLVRGQQAVVHEEYPTVQIGNPDHDVTAQCDLVEGSPRSADRRDQGPTAAAVCLHGLDLKPGCLEISRRR